MLQPTIIPTLNDLKEAVNALPHGNSPTLFCTPLPSFSEEKMNYEDGVQYQIQIVPSEKGAWVLDAQSATMKNGEITMKPLDKSIFKSLIG
jgi:hypothetical protein